MLRKEKGKGATRLCWEFNQRWRYKTCIVYGGGVMSGRRAGQVLTSTTLRAQNRTAKGSTLLRRRSTLPIYEHYLSTIWLGSEARLCPIVRCWWWRGWGRGCCRAASAAAPGTMCSKRSSPRSELEERILFITCFH